ncbi:MAG: sialidase family protein [Bdellovibrionales bacterium]
MLLNKFHSCTNTAFFDTLTPGTGPQCTYPGTWNEHVYTPTGMSSMMSLNLLSPITTADGSIFIGAATSDSSYINYAWYVFKSTDGGATWTESDNFIDSSPASNYLNLMLKDNNDNLYAIGSRYDGTNNYLIIRRSTDSGLTWTQVTISQR